METHQGRSVHMQGLWTPATPAKANGSRSNSIYNDGQGGLLSQAWAEQGPYLSSYTQQNDPQTLLSYSISAAERSTYTNISNNGWGVSHETPSLSGRVQLENGTSNVQRRGLEGHLSQWNNQGLESKNGDVQRRGLEEQLPQWRNQGLEGQNGNVHRQGLEQHQPRWSNQGIEGQNGDVHRRGLEEHLPRWSNQGLESQNGNVHRRLEEQLPRWSHQGLQSQNGNVHRQGLEQHLPQWNNQGLENNNGDVHSRGFEEHQPQWNNQGNNQGLEGENNLNVHRRGLEEHLPQWNNQGLGSENGLNVHRRGLEEHLSQWSNQGLGSENGQNIRRQGLEEPLTQWSNQELGSENALNVHRRGLEQHLPRWSSQGRRSVMNHGPNLGSSNYPRFSSWELPSDWNNNGVGVGVRENGAALERNFADSLGGLDTMSFGDLLGLNQTVTSQNNGVAASNGMFGPGWVSRPETSRSNNVALINNQRDLRAMNHHMNGHSGRGTLNDALPQQFWNTSNASLPPTTKPANGSVTFAPETPYSRQRIQRDGPLDQAHLDSNQGLNGQNVLQQHDFGAKTVDLQEPHNNKVSEPIKDSLPAKGSTTVDEDYNPDKDKEVIQDFDLNKTPQKKPRRRRYMPKVIRENKPKRTPKPKIADPTDAKETHIKTKYAQTNKTSTPETTTPGEASEPKPTEAVIKSCKRSLRFDLNGQMANGGFDTESSASEYHKTDNSSQAVNFMHERELMNKTAMMAYDLNCAINQELSEYISLPVKEKLDSSQFYMNNSLGQKVSTSSSPCASSSERVLTRGSKRSLSYITDQPYFDIGIGAITQSALWQSNSTPSKTAHAEILPQSFIPDICKKKRTEKIQRVHIQSTSSSATASADVSQFGKAHSQPQVEHLTSKYYYGNSALYGVNGMTNNQADVMRRSENMEQFAKTWADLSRFKKKRTKVVTRVRDMSPLTGIASVAKGASKGHYPCTDIVNSVFSCTDALAAGTSATPRSKKRSIQQHSVNKNWNIVLYDNNRTTKEAIGSNSAQPWRNRSDSIESVTKLFQQLDINRKNRKIPSKEKGIVPYDNRNQNALVLYEKGGSIVPFEGPFNPIRKRRPRARVELDDETTRVWRLLLENIDNEGIDGTDEDKAKWWDNERTVFRGRVDSFIARMRLVQGDRRFTPWKGSVLDSVIGVFLTQNVSDHLSSSAFMSMAARFPLKTESSGSPLSEVASALFPEPEIFEPEESIIWDEKVMDQPTLGRNSRVVYDLVHRKVKEVISSDEITGKAGQVSPTECSSESCQKAPKDSRAFNLNRPSTETEAPYILVDDQARENATSPQQSVISSQNSINSPNQKTTGILDTFSESNSRGQVVTTNCKLNYLESTASFMGLLKMAESSTQTHPQDQLEGIKSVSEYYQEAPGLSSSANQLSLEAGFCLEEALGFEILEVESSPDISRKDENSPTTEQSNFHSELTDQEKSLDTFPRATQTTSSCYVLEGETMVMQSQPQKVKQPLNHITSSAHAETSPSYKGINLELLSQEMADLTESTRGLERRKTHGKKVAQNPEKNNASGRFSAMAHTIPPHFSSQKMADVTESTRGLERTKAQSKTVNHHPVQNYVSPLLSDMANTAPRKPGNGRAGKEKKNEFDWDSLRRDAQVNGKRPECANTMDSLDWEAVRHANVNDIAETIRERGMNNMLAERIKAFLDRVVKDHGSTDLEWIRDVPPDKAKEYLLSFRGLGLKSVECIRLLTLHHLAFPVDTNVGRIAVRLGWVPLQPLPESLQLHLLEMYPILESIQKYLWPRLCKLDQKTLYELHYHMITFGKVFCTKRQPNCNACPLRGECRHFASAFASARFALPGPEEKSIVPSSGTTTSNVNERAGINLLPSIASWSDSYNAHSNFRSYDNSTNQFPSFPLSLPFPQNVHLERKSINSKCEPIVEVPASPEQEPQHEQDLCDIEDTFYEDPNEIPTIDLNMKEFTQTLENFMQANRELQETGISNALVALKPDTASIPTPKLKNINRLRTEHYVYELPDTHPLLHGMEKREPDDPCSYLLALWTPGETASSIDPPARRCSLDDPNLLCNEETCSYCSSQRETESQIVRGTLLIPTRTAMRGSFPLNGTYFQVNEVFADHDSSLTPIAVPRNWLWNLPRRTVYFGTSIPSIFKGLNTEDIQHCFWRGYVCVRGFDKKTRAPRPLIARLHFPASRTRGVKGKVYDE